VCVCVCVCAVDLACVRALVAKRSGGRDEACVSAGVGKGELCVCSPNRPPMASRRNATRIPPSFLFFLRLFLNLIIWFVACSCVAGSDGGVEHLLDL
jgi:hypothetical protein